MEDTIVAISTSLGVGAISIVRVSGDEAIEIVNSIFSGHDLTKVNSHTVHYGYIKEDKKIIDEVLVTVMKAPKTFTREDVVEINCHGGIMTTKKVMELLIRKGCKVAEPGEFTKRAFLNGRIDLLEAEAVMDVIEAKTESNMSLALNQLTGSISNKIEDLRQEIVELLTFIEVSIDYPEYDEANLLTNDRLKNGVQNILKKIDIILKNSEDGIILKNGIKTIILGKPNVGKSSLLNTLLEEEKAIVTSIPGTTRDVVEGSINIGGIILDMMDTAGIRKTDDKIEEIGVKKSLDLISKANLILYLIDSSSYDKEDLELLKNIKDKKVIVVINKIDLNNDINIDIPYPIVKISAKEKIGIDELKDEITNLFNQNKLETKDLTYLTNARSIALLKQAKDSLQSSLECINNKMPTDISEIDLKEAWNLLGMIIGKTYEDELIDNLFSRFCLGK